MPAFDPIDIAINSGLTLLELRDVTLARAEDAREIVLRIPRSERLESQFIEEAHDGDSVIVAEGAQPPTETIGSLPYALWSRRTRNKTGTIRVLISAAFN
jgi:hypothetical protein